MASGTAVGFSCATSAPEYEAGSPLCLILGMSIPFPNAEPGLGANTNTAAFLNRRGGLFAVQQDKKTRPVYSAKGFYSDQLFFNLLARSERQNKT